jgi:hypothetical protein
MSSAEETDHQLVERVQKGDRRAFDVLVLKYQHRIYSLVTRFVRDPDEVQDVVQEAFIKAYRALPGFPRRERVLSPGCTGSRSTPRRITSCRGHAARAGPTSTSRTRSTSRAARRCATWRVQRT